MKTSMPQILLLVALMTGIQPAVLAQTPDPPKPPAEQDPFDPKNDLFKIEEGTIKVVYEVFSLPMTSAAELQRAGLTDEVFYAKMLGGLKEKTVKQESFLIARATPGQKVEVSESREYTYASSFEPPELPNAFAGSKAEEGGKKSPLKIFPVTPATPSAFQTKVLGETLEVTAETVAGDAFIALRLVATRASFIQKDVTGQGAAKVEMPRFSAPKIVTSVSTKSGKPSYLGTMSFPAELQPKEGEQRVSFAFVTATKIKQ